FATSRAGVGLMFAWAVAEAIFWPVIPDFLLVPLAAGAGRRFYKPLAAAVLGAALGGSALYLLAFWAPDAAWSLLRHAPLVDEGRIAAFQAQFAAGGVVAFLGQP